MQNIEKIQNIGSFDKLPCYPFKDEGEYALFPSSGDELVAPSLYHALFTENKKLGNSDFYFIANNWRVGVERPYAIQREIDWETFDNFQYADLVYLGFYMSGNKHNWLGIYHPNDYIIIGGNDSFVKGVTKQVYGEGCWKEEFTRAFLAGKVSIYTDDFEILKKNLF